MLAFPDEKQPPWQPGESHLESRQGKMVALPLENLRCGHKKLRGCNVQDSGCQNEATSRSSGCGPRLCRYLRFLLRNGCGTRRCVARPNDRRCRTSPLSCLRNEFFGFKNRANSSRVEGQRSSPSPSPSL